MICLNDQSPHDEYNSRAAIIAVIGEGNKMPAYANKGGNSGVVSYETTAESITVQFKDGWKYVYDSNKPGAATVAKMKELAQAGHGLNSYISSVVKKNFSDKHR